MDPSERVVPGDAKGIPLGLEPVQDLHAAVTQENEDVHAACWQTSPHGDPVHVRLCAAIIVRLKRGPPRGHVYCIAIRRLIRCCVALPRVARRVQEDTKVPLSLRMDRELYEWLVKKRDSGRFYNLTHAIEEGVRALQRQEK